MDGKEFAERLSYLRCVKEISARDMSMALGKSHSYINSIENGRKMPSMEKFFDICDFFEITPKEFFDDDNKSPADTKLLVEKIKRLDANQHNHILALVNELIKANI